jgi:hypothetical protein
VLFGLTFGQALVCKISKNFFLTNKNDKSFGLLKKMVADSEISSFSRFLMPGFSN